MKKFLFSSHGLHRFSVLGQWQVCPFLDNCWSRVGLTVEAVGSFGFQTSWLWCDLPQVLTVALVELGLAAVPAQSFVTALRSSANVIDCPASNSEICLEMYRSASLSQDMDGE